LFRSADYRKVDWTVKGSGMKSRETPTRLRKFFLTDANRALLMQRTILGAVFFPHGAQKLLGAFGGYGFSGTMGFFTGTMHIPAPIAFLVIMGEFFGSLGLVLGAGTRACAFGVTAIMLGAVFTTHLDVGFFMNWFGNQKGEGFEYHLLALALSVPLLVWGGGEYSIDRWLAARLTVPSSITRPHAAA
jgi:putative oxidoreductase